MPWLKVKNDTLQSVLYKEYGMTEKKEVTDNRKIQVSQEVHDKLKDHPSGDFEPADVQSTHAEEEKAAEIIDNEEDN